MGFICGFNCVFRVWGLGVEDVYQMWVLMCV